MKVINKTSFRGQELDLDEALLGAYLGRNTSKVTLERLNR